MGALGSFIGSAQLQQAWLLASPKLSTAPFKTLLPELFSAIDVAQPVVLYLLWV